MISGLFGLTYHLGNKGNSSTAVLRDGRIRGGDSTYFYVGTYAEESGFIRGEVLVTHWIGPMDLVFGQFRQIRLILALEIQGQGRAFAGYAHPPHEPAQKMSLKGVLLADA